MTLASGELERASVLMSLDGPAEDDIRRLMRCPTSAAGTPFELDVDVRPHPDAVSFLTGKLCVKLHVTNDDKESNNGSA